MNKIQVFWISKQINNILLCVVFIFLLSSCGTLTITPTNPIASLTATDTAIPTFTSSPTITLTPTTTPTRTATPTQTFTITSTATLTPTITPTSTPSATPIFYENFSNISQYDIDNEFIIQCNKTFLDINSVGLYSIRVKEQTANTGYCVLIPKVETENGIQKVNVKLHYISGSNNTYAGFYNKCGTVVVGYWINLEKFIYSNETRKFEMLDLTPTENDYHEISVIYGEKIQVFVDQEEIVSDELSILFDCPGYPSSISVGVWVQPQFHVSANLDEIAIWGR